MFRLACDAGLLVSCPSFASLVQWRAADAGNDHWYEAVVSPTRVTWQQARTFAEARGGHLATLTSAAEDAFVFSLVVNRPEFWNNTFGGPWLGGYQPDPTVPAADGWVWVTGEAWAYTNWAWGEPGDQHWPSGQESYLHFRDATGGWNDFTSDDNATYSYIVEYAVPAPSTTVVLGVLSLLPGRRRR